MKRYFFDVVKRDRSELDYMGQLFPTAQEAYDAAELMALDLVVTHEDEMIGSAVTVSSTEGRRLFSIPVQASYLTARCRRHDVIGDSPERVVTVSAVSPIVQGAHGSTDGAPR